MPSRDEVAYFGAGPAPLPTPVLEKSAAAFINFENTGLSMAEISHRSSTADKVIADAKAALTHLLDIPDNYDILFLQGGGTGEFSASLQNAVGYWVERRRRRAVADLGEGKDAEVLERVKKEIEEEFKVDYLVTGTWSRMASDEAARLIGKKYVNVALDSRNYNDGKFGRIPEESEWKLSSKKSAMIYYCDNETVNGVEFQSFPKSFEDSIADKEDNETVIAADMSSNFLSRKVDIRKYGIIFAGAQKNLGVTGITLVIIRKSLLALTPSPTFMHSLSGVLPSAIPPVVFDFATLSKNNSLYNTLPIFTLYVAVVVLQSLVSQFESKKVSGQEEIVDRKAKLLYDTLDAYPDVFKVVPEKSVRSRMNVCFRIASPQSDGKPDEAREKEFVSGGEKRGLLGTKGHRSVGGIRVSNYNAVPMENVEKLAAYMNEFAKS